MEPGLISSGWPATSWRRLINVVHYRGQKDGERTRTVNSRIRDSWTATLFLRNICEYLLETLYLESPFHHCGSKNDKYFSFAKIIHARNANILL